MDLLNDTKAVALWLLTAIMSLLAWLGSRHIKRLEDLEQRAATKEEIRKALDEIREERRINHAENSQKLDRVIEKIDQNELRASNSRHELNDYVHQLALKVAVASRDRRSDDG